MKVGIFGTGAYGMALASILIDNNCNITMWTKFEEEKDNLVSTRKNENVLPGFILDPPIEVTTDLEKCIKNKDLLIIVIPVPFVEKLCIDMSKYIETNQHILIASKGIEKEKGLFIHEIVKNNINTDKISVLSGGSFAIDVIKKKPIGLSLATKNEETAKTVVAAMSNYYTKLRVTRDIIGTEVCGAIKNVIAIASGILDGLGTTESTRAMLITEALHDIEDIILALGGDKKTILSYAGFGDILLTCTSSESRNYEFGKKLCEKMDKKEIDEYLSKHTVEGYNTLESVYRLLNNKKVNIPIIEIIYNIVNKGMPAEKLLTFIVEKD